ncbi:hypothetical protein PYCCODRAFT_1341652, partial [Trametes coccinea BRFM310]
ETYNHAAMVMNVLPVVSFVSHTVSLPVIDENTLFTREDISFARSGTGYFLPMHFHESICSTKCQFERFMSLRAASHSIPILRYCENCKAWFHLSCCPPFDALSVLLLPPAPDRPPHPSSFTEVLDLTSLGRVPFSLSDWISWQQLLTLPIQRGCQETHFPLSFECLVFDIRKQHRYQGCPPNVDNWLLRHLHPAPHLEHNAHALLNQFRAWTPPVPVACPRC